jgi:hypothetical protein
MKSKKLVRERTTKYRNQREDTMINMDMRTKPDGTARTAAQQKSDRANRQRQIVGMTCSKIFDAKAVHRKKRRDLWRIVLLCDLAFYDTIEKNRAEIQNRTGTRLIDIVLSYENANYLEVIDIPQEYTVFFRKLLDIDGEEKPVLSDYISTGLFYSLKDAQKHLDDMRAEFADECMSLHIRERDSFMFDEHDPEGSIRSGDWRLRSILDHQQMIATHRVHGDVEVDAGLVQFLEALWELGYETVYSCEGRYAGGGETEPHSRYIMFENEAHAERFFRQFGGVLDGQVYNQGRRCVRDFTIPANIEIYRPTS